MPTGLARTSDRPALAAHVLGLWPYALIAFLYFATSPYHAGLNNPNEMVRVYMTAAIAEDGTFAIERELARWGGVDDKAARDGHLYSSKAPLQSLLGVPVAKVGTVPSDKRIFTTRLRRVTSALPSLLFSWVLLAWCRRRAPALGAPPKMGTAAGLTLALGTMIYPYALTFTGHAIAAVAAGGAYFVTILMSRRAPGTALWMILAVLLGALAGAAPFAEYPAALMALPALVAAFWAAGDLRRRAVLLGLLAVGGAVPFALGLWAHWKSWGSPFKTGYGFLENKAYVEVHKGGFFGVGAPKLEAFGGSLFSPGTGLLFYSPVLVIGVAALIIAVVTGKKRSTREITLLGERANVAEPLRLSLAVAALAGVAFELLFISAHSGWRGGWTVGPRYIISVAPVLGLWVVEALAMRWARRVLPPLAALSIVITGLAAALYPHLSDVYTNPIATFLWPSYGRGEISYGLAHGLGLTGHAANALHAIPILLAAAYVATSDVSLREPREALAGVGRSAVVMGLMLMLVRSIPEQNATAAHAENERLWGFWEPARPKKAEPGLISTARAHWGDVVIQQLPAKGDPRPCIPEEPERCRYGDQGWHHFGPDSLDMDGKREPILFLHPMTGAVIQAQIPLPANAHRAVVRYGLADASVASDNPSPVRIQLNQGTTAIGYAEAKNVRGLKALPLTLTSTAPLVLELRVDRDGARVFGFDVSFYE